MQIQFPDHTPCNLLHPAFRRFGSRYATPKTSDVEIEWLPEWAVRRYLGGSDQQLDCSLCHDRNIHTFDSLSNAMWVGNWVCYFPTPCL